MNPERGSSLTFFLLGLSALIMGACVLGGIVLALDSGGGGFFPGLGKALGLLLVMAGNLTSWLLNLICWFIARQRWLGIVVAIQSMPAILFAGWMAILGLQEFQDERAFRQRAHVTDAIKGNKLPAFQQASKQCGTRCRDSLSPQRELLLASLHGAHDIARHLIAEGVRPYRQGSGSIEFHDAHVSLYTCEGRSLPLLNAVDVAVANRDMTMLALLWPISDDRAQFTAARTAAELDRLEMLKFMDIGQDRRELLHAAASGAATQTGHWLLADPNNNFSDNDIQDALLQLLSFMFDISTPRSIEFGKLLQEEGADIHTAQINDMPALQYAVRLQSREMVQQLLELGADPAGLSAEYREQMETLLQKPDRPAYHRSREDCVAP